MRWVSNKDGRSWTVTPAAAPPDGTCMNCRSRPGLYFPDFEYYSCEECLNQASRAVGWAPVL